MTSDLFPFWRPLKSPDQFSIFLAQTTVKNKIIKVFGGLGANFEPKNMKKRFSAILERKFGLKLDEDKKQTCSIIW